MDAEIAYVGHHAHSDDFKDFLNTNVYGPGETVHWLIEFTSCKGH